MYEATIPNPMVMEFEMDTNAIFKEVRHYNLTKGANLFSHKINLSLNRGHSNANYVYSLKIRQQNKWSRQITGLFTTDHADIFYGDTRNKTNLLLAQFTNDGHTLRLYYFKDFYTKEVGRVINILIDSYGQ